LVRSDEIAATGLEQSQKCLKNRVSRAGAAQNPASSVGKVHNSVFDQIEINTVRSSATPFGPCTARKVFIERDNFSPDLKSSG